MNQPLNDAELNSLLGEFHRGMLHEWTTTFTQRQYTPPSVERWSDHLMSGIDLQDTDGLNTHRFLQVTISDLLTDVTAHLGDEGAMVVNAASARLRRLFEGLERGNLTWKKAEVLTAGLAKDEEHLRAMVNFDFAGSTCRKTHQALDDLRASIGYLTRQVQSRIERHHHDLAGH